MWVYGCVGVYLGVWVCGYVGVWVVYRNRDMKVNTFVCKYLYIHTCMYKSAYMNVHTQCGRAFTHIHTHVDRYMYIQTHTYIIYIHMYTYI